MRKRLAARLRGERGAVLVLVAVSMFAILGITAMVVDVGGWYQARRQLQSAADAGALAASDDLPGSPTNAAIDAQSYVAKHITGAPATVTTPYNSNSSNVKVTVTKTLPSIFGGILGLNSQ